MTNEADPTWHWVEPGVPAGYGNGLVYRTVKMRYTDKGKKFERDFKIGDTVYMYGEQHGERPKWHLWFAQILNFFESASPPAEGRVAGYVLDQRKKWVSFRWFTNPSDVNRATKWEDSDLRPSAPRPKENELYFSDHVEVKPGSNPVSVILGRCLLVDSEAKMGAFPNNRYIASDKIRLVRIFYEHMNNIPPRMRYLRKGELAYRLSNPTQKPLYNRRTDGSGVSLLSAGRNRGSDAESKHKYSPDSDIDLNQAKDRNRTFPKPRDKGYLKQIQAANEETSDDYSRNAANHNDNSGDDSMENVRQKARVERVNNRKPKAKSVFDDDDWEDDDDDKEMEPVLIAPLSLPPVPRRRREVVEASGQAPRSSAIPHRDLPWEAMRSELQQTDLSGTAGSSAQHRPRKEVIEASGRVHTARNSGDGSRRGVRKDVVEDSGFAPSTIRRAAPGNASSGALENTVGRNVIGDTEQPSTHVMGATAENTKEAVDDWIAGIVTDFLAMKPETKKAVLGKYDELMAAIARLVKSGEYDRTTAQGQRDFAVAILAEVFPDSNNAK